jgi:hypothetical protein
MMKFLLLAALLLQAQPRETKPQIKRILVQSYCLAIAYPGTEMAKDMEAIYALYAPLSGLQDPLGSRRKVEALAAREKPAEPSPVGGRNLALAKCALFAERADVLALLR